MNIAAAAPIYTQSYLNPPFNYDAVLAGDPSCDPGGERQGERHLIDLGHGDQSAHQPAAAAPRQLRCSRQAAGDGSGIPGQGLRDLRHAYHAGMEW